MRILSLCECIQATLVHGFRKCTGAGIYKQNFIDVPKCQIMHKMNWEIFVDL